jgi:hypothetical protein
MRAREVVEVAGGEPPVEDGRGGVVALHAGGQTGLDCARWLVGGDCGNQPPAGAPAGAPVVIVVLLVSATRRTTEHCAHHDRDGAPATKGARRTSGRQPVTPTNFRWRPPGGTPTGRMAEVGRLARVSSCRPAAELPARPRSPSPMSPVIACSARRCQPQRPAARHNFVPSTATERTEGTPRSP